MATLKLYSDIVDNETKVWYNWDGLDATTSDDVVRFIGDIPASDNEICIRINCRGGYMTEGWRIYDALRQSGKKISAIVEGICASMATIVLLAAPKERRYAYENSSFLIHDPACCSPDLGGWPDRITADELDKMAAKLGIQASELRNELDKVINVYVERTNADEDTLRALMKDETMLTTAKAKELGFICDTLAPNTDFKKYMNTNNDVTVKQGLLARLLAKCGFASVDAVKFNDLVFTDTTGRDFTVEREEGKYAIGDNASPDGKFVMEDGTTVVISNGTISDIIAAKMELKNPETDAVISEEEAQQLLNTYFNKIKEQESTIDNLRTANTDLDKKLKATDTDLNEARQTIDAIKATHITDEQRDMLKTIDEAGGKTWFDAMAQMQSKGAPKKPQKQMGGTDGEQRLGSAFLDGMTPYYRVKK